MNISYQDTAVSGGMVSLFSSDAIQPFSTTHSRWLLTVCVSMTS